MAYNNIINVINNINNPYRQIMQSEFSPAWRMIQLQDAHAWDGQV